MSLVACSLCTNVYIWCRLDQERNTVCVIPRLIVTVTVTEILKAPG